MSLDDRLKKRAQGWAGLTTRYANQNLGKFKRLIAVKSSVSENGGKITITSIATGIAARAYEYGSGIHSRLKSKRSKMQQADGKILIKPKTKKVLAFFWDKVDANTPSGQKFIGISPDSGKALFRYVEHPGVEAANGGRGYLAPAINEVRKTIRKKVPQDVREEVGLAFKRAFKK